VRERNTDRSGFSRRRFIACGGTAVTGAWLVECGQPVKAAQSLPMTADYDIVVCGGGTSGLPAAVAAARTGARVAIVERYGWTKRLRRSGM